MSLAAIPSLFTKALAVLGVAAFRGSELADLFPLAGEGSRRPEEGGG